MRINFTSPSFKANPIKILAENNRHKKYLYNEVSDIVKNEQLAAIFHNMGIDILSATKTTIEKLKTSGIKFNKVV